MHEPKCECENCALRKKISDMSKDELDWLLIENGYIPSVVEEWARRSANQLQKMLDEKGAFAQSK